MDTVYEGIGVCKSCAERIERLNHKCCLDSNTNTLVISPYYYTGELRSAFLDFKFRGQELYGYLFGHMLCGELEGTGMLDGYDTVVPVPLHKNRLCERGYNQAEIIAEEFSVEMGLEFAGAALKRIKETKRQRGLTGTDRAENVRDAFEADSTLVRDKNIILIDDISTMGMTMNACKKALMAAGAGKVAEVAMCKTKLK